eukprot:6924992-Pyramimonas_sp.AAC.2
MLFNLGRGQDPFGCTPGASMPPTHPPRHSWSQPFWLKACVLIAALRIREGVPAQSPPPVRAVMGKKGIAGDTDQAPKRQKVGASAAQERASAAASRSGGVRVCLICKANEKDSTFPTKSDASESACLRCYTIWLPAKRFITFAEYAAMYASDAEHKQN